MTRQLKQLNGFAITAVMVGCTLVLINRVSAQADPFGGGDPAAPATPAAPVDPSDEKDLVVIILRESNPTTPIEVTRAMRSMMNYGRPDEARRYMAKLLAGKPDADTLVAIHREFSSAFFYRLRRYAPLEPEGPVLAQTVLEAAHLAARDPARIESLIRDLNNPSEGIRSVARRGLAEAGVDAVTPMVQVLADDGRKAEHAAVQGGLAHLGTIAVDPLIGVLQSPDEALVTQAVHVLGLLRSRRAMVYLLRPYLADSGSAQLRATAGLALRRIIGATPKLYEARAYLHRRASSYYGGEEPGKIDLQDMIELWHWDATSNASVPQQYPPKAAALLVASRLAGDLYQLDSSNKESLRLYLSASLESAKLLSGLDKPLPKGPVHSVCAKAGVEALQDVIVHAMKDGHVAAAIGAADVLADIGDQSLLQSDDGRQRVLVRALRHGDRRLRFAAARAILKIDPQRPFPGSSHLVNLLGLLVGTVGERRVLIGDPRVELAQSLVGILNESGIDAQAAATGRGFFQAAVSNPDYEFLLLSDGIDRPYYKEVLQMLRRDPRTSNLPIGLIARGENLAEVKRFAERDPLALVFPWPYDRSAISFEAQRLVALAGSNLVFRKEKIDQAIASLDALTRFVENPDQYGHFDVMRHQDFVVRAMDTPELLSRAMKLLGLLGTARAQRALVDFASQNARPLADRKAAAAEFARTLKRRGTMLTTDQIRTQYDRYNQSEVLDQETQQLLASILDMIEAKRNAADKERQPNN